VADVQTVVEEEAGLEKAKQGVMFQGKKLEADAMLADAGVSEGDTLNIIPTKKKVEDDDDEADLFGSDEAGGDLMDSAMNAMGGMPGAGDLKEGIDAMMKDMQGEGGGLDPTKLKAMMGQFKEMYNNPMFKKVFEDPEMLEQGRKMILSNPMLMNMYESMGMGEIVKDPEAYRKQMMGLKDMLDAQQGQLGGMMGGAEELDDFDDGEL